MGVNEGGSADEPVSMTATTNTGLKRKTSWLWQYDERAHEDKKLTRVTGKHCLLWMTLSLVGLRENNQEKWRGEKNPASTRKKENETADVQRREAVRQKGRWEAKKRGSRDHRRLGACGAKRRTCRAGVPHRAAVGARLLVGGRRRRWVANRSRPQDSPPPHDLGGGSSSSGAAGGTPKLDRAA